MQNVKRNDAYLHYTEGRGWRYSGFNLNCVVVVAAVNCSQAMGFFLGFCVCFTKMGELALGPSELLVVIVLFFVYTISQPLLLQVRLFKNISVLFL